MCVGQFANVCVQSPRPQVTNAVGDRVSPATCVQSYIMCPETPALYDGTLDTNTVTGCLVMILFNINWLFQ